MGNRLQAAYVAVGLVQLLHQRPDIFRRPVLHQRTPRCQRTFQISLHRFGQPLGFDFQSTTLQDIQCRGFDGISQIREFRKLNNPLRPRLIGENRIFVTIQQEMGHPERDENGDQID